MKKFNRDIFFDILSGKNKKNLVKKMSILRNPQVLFQYALAKGYGFNKKGLWYDFINDLFDMDQYSIKSKLNELDKQIRYKSILAIKDGDEKHVFFLDVGLLNFSKKDKYFLIYSFNSSDSYDYPEVVKIYNSQKKIDKKLLLKDTYNVLKKNGLLTPVIKKKIKIWVKKYKKRKKYPGKTTKLEMLKSEKERLKWELDKSKRESDDFFKMIIFVVGIMLLSYLLGFWGPESGPAWKL